MARKYSRYFLPSGLARALATAGPVCSTAVDSATASAATEAGGSLEQPRQWPGAQWAGLSPWGGGGVPSCPEPPGQEAYPRGGAEEAQEPSWGAAQIAL